MMLSTFKHWYFSYHFQAPRHIYIFFSINFILLL